jgi:hypothetical protein
MNIRSNQVSLAKTLAWFGRAEGWPYVRDEIVSNDAHRNYMALGNIENFEDCQIQSEVDRLMLLRNCINWRRPLRTI